MPRPDWDLMAVVVWLVLVALIGVLGARLFFRVAFETGGGGSVLQWFHW